MGFYYGPSKPPDINAYLSEFTAEFGELLKSGVVIENTHYNILLHSFVCDAPARAMVKQIKGHSGYFGCDKCKQQGEWHD